MFSMDQEQQKENESPVEASTATQPVEQANKEVETTKEASAAAQNVTSENGCADETPKDVAMKSQSPKLYTPKSLRARSNISKKSSASSSLKSKKTITATPKLKQKIVKIVKYKCGNNVEGKAGGSSGRKNMPVGSMNTEATEMKTETPLLGSEGKNDQSGGNNKGQDVQAVPAGKPDKHIGDMKDQGKSDEKERQDVQAVPGEKPGEHTGDMKDQGKSHVKESRGERAQKRRRKSGMVLKEKNDQSGGNNKGQDVQAVPGGKPYEHTGDLKDQGKSNEKERRDVQAVPGEKPGEHTGDMKDKGKSHVKESRGEKARKRRRKSRMVLKEKERLKSANSVENQKNEEKSGSFNQDKKREKKEEKLGGLIFMCNKQTKPDCLRYGVMGVSESKKDFVLGIKPGLKLFLFDYDLKLLYGIYRASSAGGMKLEPRAFGGSFPAQVHFKVHLDCYPLPESDLKKAMKENYTTRHKFKTELTVQQVRKLMKLFRPVELRPSLPHHPSNSRARSPPKAGRDDRNGHPARESRHLSQRETDHYADADLRRHPVAVYERKRGDAMRERVPVGAVGSPRDLFLTEREYRAYGLQGERRNLEYEREPLRRQPEVMHLDAIPARRDYVLDQPSYLNGYQTHPVDARRELPPRVRSPIREAYADDTYYAYERVAASRDAYTHELRRDNLLPGHASGSDRVARLYPRDTERARRDVDEIGRAYLSYPRSEYEQAHLANAQSLPVSSRYYYAGRRI